jgi:hypothetical protein
MVPRVRSHLPSLRAVGIDFACPQCDDGCVHVGEPNVHFALLNNVRNFTVLEVVAHCQMAVWAKGGGWQEGRIGTVVALY